ncbi:MAG: ABC transporter transmembrane domain-containing protein, partial [Paracoccaceae bacterium]
LGTILDVVLDAGPENVIADQGLFLAGAAIFILFARPLTFMFSAYMQSVVIGPNLRKMVMTRLHRWTLGHSTTFFDNDFAGRIAQKEVTAARALTDVVVEFLHTVLFAVASIVAAFVIVATIDWRIGAMVILWVFGFFCLMKYYLPRIRVRSAVRAEAQAVTTGQIVDTVSNVKVVKLFANAFYEDKAALKAFDFLRQTSKDYGVMLIWFRMALLTYSGVIFIGVIFATIYLWMNGQATPGAVVAGGSVAMRLMMWAGGGGWSMRSGFCVLGGGG